jgi:AcrR family transcriptional regulator
MSPYHHGNLRGTLIEAGIELINREGEKGFSLRRVCALCGVSQAAPYSHFASKEDLVEAMKAYVMDQFTEALRDAASGVEDPRDPKVLVEMGKRYVLFFLSRPEYFTFLFSEPRFRLNLSLDAEAENSFPPYELFKGHVLRVYPDLPREQAEDMIIAMWSTVHGLASIATMKNVRYDKNWEEKIEDIIWNKGS